MSIIFDNISFSYKTPHKQEIFKDFSLQIKAGERSGIFHASSWGKTTLVKLIAGEEKLRSGKIIINGYEVTRWKEMFSTLSILFQDPEKQFMFPNLKDEYDFVTKNQREKEIVNAIDELAQIFDFELNKFIANRRSIFSVSNEERKILQILFTVPIRKENLILDDPLLYLSEKMQKKMLKYLDESSKTILVLARSENQFRSLFQN